MGGADITPLVASGRQLIDSYGEGRFRIAGVVHAGSVLVLPERVEPWLVTEAAAVTFASLAPVTEEEPPPEILLVGCGKRFGPAPAGLGAALRQAAVALEWMDTGAACRTFNVLLSEERRVAAALIAVD
jgi:uncharacterized protein